MSERQRKSQHISEGGRRIKAASPTYKSMDRINWKGKLEAKGKTPLVKPHLSPYAFNRIESQISH